MKKLIALSLSLLMVLSLAACNVGGKDDGTTAAPETTVAAEPAPADSLEVMNKIWALYTDPETTPWVMGGSLNEEFVPAGDGVPGTYDSAMLADLTGILYIPEAEIANIDGAATAIHGMMANNFSSGVVHCTGDVAAFANTMVDALKNTQWICGQPEVLLVATLGEYVVIAFGVNDIIAPFVTNLTTAYPNAQIVENGPLF